MWNKRFLPGALTLLVFSASAQVERDPTRPGSLSGSALQAQAGQAEPVWIVDAVMISSLARRAIINGQVLAEGELINKDVRVVQISADQVLLTATRNGQQQKITLPVNEVSDIKALASDTY